MRKLLIPDISFAALDAEGTLQKATAVQQLQQLVSLPSKPGDTFTIEEIRQRLPLVDKLANAAEVNSREVLLEDLEYSILLQAVQASTWMGVSRAALELVEAVEKAEDIEVAEA